MSAVNGMDDEDGYDLDDYCLDDYCLDEEELFEELEKSLKLKKRCLYDEECK